MSLAVSKATNALSTGGSLYEFMPNCQRLVLRATLSEEESEGIAEIVLRMAEIVEEMPKTYGQDGLGMESIAYLHYFYGQSDFWITEKDVENPQLQAFGLADLGYGGELGYISIDDVIRNGVELDLYFEPKTLREIKGEL